MPNNQNRQRRTDDDEDRPEMRRLLCAVLCAALLAATSSAAAASEPLTRVLLVGKDRDHAYRTHEYMAECRLLAKCLAQTPRVETMISNGWPDDAEKTKDLDAIVLYTANGGDVLFGGPHRRQIKELLDGGTGLVAVHWSTGATSDATGQPLLSALGGWFSTDFSRLDVRKTDLRLPEPDHPIAAGWSGYALRDEYYLDLKFLSAARPMITVEIDGKVFPVGWIYERAGGGRSFGFVCGHFHDNFGIEAFRRAITNAILWTAHREVPAGGAPVEITAADLELPPDERN